MKGLRSTDFHFDGLDHFYRGKVRDVYFMKNGLMVAIATDRISAFDRILPKSIPYKGQVLNQIAAFFLESTSDIIPNWLKEVPDPNVSLGYQCEPIRVEMVIRGYLAGHAWREYKSGKRSISGVEMPDGMRENDPFPEPIITPATKAEEGHDEDISREEILKRRLVDPDVYRMMEIATRQLFERGQEMAAKQGLILVDTKYEFGMREDELYLIDEIHTPDSSRYFYAGEYEQRQEEGLRQEQLSKEFVREWLMDHGFSGQEGQDMPDMPNRFVEQVSARYRQLYERLTGEEFEPARQDNIRERVYSKVQDALKKLSS